MDMIKKIIEAVSGLEAEEIDSDVNLFSLGLDSLMLVQIKKKIDHKFQVVLPVARIMSDVDTIEKVAQFIIENQSTRTVDSVELESADTSDKWNTAYQSREDEEQTEEEITDNVLTEQMPPREVLNNTKDVMQHNYVQDVMEMQLKMMAESMQNLVSKQLETITHLEGKQTEPYRQISDKNYEELSQRAGQEVRQENRQDEDVRQKNPQKNKEVPQINFRAVKLDRDIFTGEQKRFIKEFIARYNQKTKRSKEYAKRNRRQFCDWITSLNFRMDFKELIYPIVSARSQGAKFWDLDGNPYLDMAIGYGVHYFGHRPQFILEALQAQMEEGYETGPQTDLGGEVAELICKITGAERVAFANTGSEAVMAALRIARTVTKKNKVVLFKGAYHGNFDAVLAESIDGETFPISPGTMQGMVEDVMVLEYATEESLQIIQEHAGEIAAVIVEPVQSRNPSLQPKEFLHQLRALTESIHAALIFDEMITGFRICPGGCQEYFGVRADLATYGKIIGGGMPIGIVAGKAAYLDAVDGGSWQYGDASYPEKEMTYFAGTFCKHPLSLAAARAVLKFIAQDGGELQKRVNKLTAYFVEKVNDYFQREKVPLKVSFFGSEFRFESNGKYDLSKLPAEIELFFYLLMEKGVYIWEKRTCFFSAAHTYEDADFFLHAIEESIREMRQGGFSFSTETEKKGNTNVEMEKKENITTIMPSQAQERYFLLSQMEVTEAGTHLPSAILIQGDFQAERAKEILQRIVDKQEVLHTCYAVEEGCIVQKVHSDCKVKVVLEDGTEENIQKYIKEFIVPFDLYEAPLLHAKIVRLAPKKFLMLLDLHHSIADGYSCTLFHKMFMDLYEGKELECLPKAYGEAAQWQKTYQDSEQFREDEKYWKEELSNVEYAVTFPQDYRRPDKQDITGGMVSGEIGESVVSSLKKLAKKEKCSLYHVLYGAFSILTAKITGKEIFTIGTPVDVRMNGGLEQTMGLFTNTMVLKNTVKQNQTVQEYVQSVKMQFGKNFEHSIYPFEMLITELEVETERNHNPLFDIMFIYENGEERVNEIAGLSYEYYEIPVEQSFFDVSFELIEENEKCKVHIYYKTSLYEESTIVGWMKAYQELLGEIAESFDRIIEKYLSKYEEEWEQARMRQNALKIRENEYNVMDTLSSSTQELMDTQKESTRIQLEEELTSYWKEILHIEEMDIHQNFFELGAKSMDAMKFHAKIGEKHNISILDLFEYPTVEQLAQKIWKQEWKQESVEESKTDAEGANHVSAVLEDSIVPKATIMPEVSNTPKISSIKNNIKESILRKNAYSNWDEETNEVKGQMPIAIIGMAGRFPKSADITEFWKNIVEQKECITFFEEEELRQEGIPEEYLDDEYYVKAKGVLEDAERFDAAFFEYSPKEAANMDPQIRLFHECAWNALEDAGYAPDSLEAGKNTPQKVGVFAGSASNYTWMSHIYQPVSNVQERLERISLNDKDYLSTRISYKFNLVGPSYGIQTACSSSLTSIHLACRSLEMQECEMALAGGVSVMLPKKTGYPYQEGMMLSKDGHCRVFDKDATGTIFSDGVGIIVLKPLHKAVQDKDSIYAVIRGSAVNNDGSQKAGYTAPSIQGQADVIRQALKHAGKKPSEITYLEAHGTGTVLGDPIEFEGLQAVYPKEQEKYCALGSLKANFGHLDAAAGVAGVIKTALALKHQVIPASILCETPNPHMDLEESAFYIPHTTQEWKRKQGKDGLELPRLAGVTSLGFGGTNAHIVLEEYPNEDMQEEQVLTRKEKMFLLSARSKETLERMEQQLEEYLEENPYVSLPRVSYSLLMGRKVFSHRKMVAAGNREELLMRLREKREGIYHHYGVVDSEKAQVVFLFTGQGSQYVNMARDLYEREFDFQTIMDHCFQIAEYKLHASVNYRQILFPPKGEEEEAEKLLCETENTQVILFILEYSMASYLMKMGIQPDAMIGHSLGEYAAACISGVFSLEDGLRFVMKRGKLMQAMERGGMDSVNIEEEQAIALMHACGTPLSVAAVNGKKNCVISGNLEDLKKFEQMLDEQQIAYQRLQTSHAFHSSMMIPMLPEFAGMFDSIPISKPKIPYISNLTGTWVTAEIAYPDYWCAHLSHTVRFYDGVTTLLQKKCIFIEVGPGKSLTSLVKRCDNGAQIKVACNMLRHKREAEDDVSYLTGRLGELWCNGVSVDFQAWNGRQKLRKLSLPGYPFKGQVFPLPNGLEKENHRKDELDFSDWFYQPCWKAKPVMEDITVSQTAKEKRYYIVIGTHNKLTQHLAGRIDKMGNLCRVLYYSERWKEELDAYLSDTKETCTIIDLMPYIEPSVECCFYDLLSLVQSIKSADIYVVTGIESLEASLADGICSVAQKECEEIFCERIEVREQEEIEVTLDCILKECLSQKDSVHVRYENGVRLVPEVEKVYMEKELAKNAGSMIRRNGNYVLTGGLGDIARYTSEYLLTQYQANLLLLAREPFTEEDEKGKFLRKWKEKGAEITIEICDICEESQVESAVMRFEETYGKVNGVFHMAGVIGDGMIQLKTEKKAESVIKPKVKGTNVLEKVFRTREIDFMLLYSSLAVVTKEVGQSDYIAANSYLNAYAKWAFKQYPNRKIHSINWDNWLNIGMAYRATKKSLTMKKYLSHGILPKDAMQVMELVLKCSYPEVIISVQDLFRYLNTKTIEELSQGFHEHAEMYQRPELTTEYVPPETAVEKEVAKVWEQVFSIEKVGRRDNFFELGGDSLHAISITHTLKKAYSIDMTDIYKYPTIQELAEHLDKNKSTLEKQLEDVKNALQEYEEVDEQWEEEQKQYMEKCLPYEKMDFEEMKELSRILLLGATGYLGIYLLKEILLQTEAEVVLIIRGKCTRIQEKFRSYFGNELYEQYKDRITVLQGEISKGFFGLLEEDYTKLSETIDCVVNASGKADHYGEYEAFYEANVEIVQQIIAFAKTGCRKEIHHMSSKGVGMGKIEGRKHVLFTEFDTDYGQEFENYYIDTKHQAEVLLRAARKDGVEVNLYRIGDLVYDSETGHFQENIEKNAVYLLVQAMLELEYLPEDLPNFMEFSYVDFVGRAIVRLMLCRNLSQETYHLQNPYRMGFTDWKELLEEEKYPITFTDKEGFFAYVMKNYENPEKKQAIENLLTYSHLLEMPYYTDIQAATEKTTCLLGKLGLTWKKAGTISLKKMIEYGVEVGFFK